MPIISRLTAMYEVRGINIATGLNPAQFRGFPLAPFTWFHRDGVPLTEGLGIALQEVYFLECLFARFRPRAVFAIGNSQGWSTLALALLNPDARVLAIDAGFDRRSREGIDLTNRIAGEEGLRVEVVEARSPGDVPRTVAGAALDPIDFAFVDGYHVPDQVKLDFDAIQAHASPDCVYLFHDVAAFSLQDGIDRVTRDSGLTAQLLLATPSGMAIVYDPARHPELADDIAPFAVTSEAVAMIEKAAWAHRHRHLARWRRSLAKRLGKGRGASG